MSSCVSTIRQVLQYAQANKIKLVIMGGGEAWECAKELAAAHVPVVIDNDINLPASFSDIGATLKGAARLDEAGVMIAFQPQNDGPAHYARTITQIAGNAVANGMKWDHALAAITKNPAAIWGIADSYGTLEPGKDGDVVIWDGDPLEVTSAPTAVFIKGDRMPMTSRQTGACATATATSPRRTRRRDTGLMIRRAAAVRWRRCLRSRVRSSPRTRSR